MYYNLYNITSLDRVHIVFVHLYVCGATPRTCLHVGYEYCFIIFYIIYLYRFALVGMTIAKNKSSTEIY